MIELVKLSKRFGSLHAVDGLSLSIQRGEVLGFLGPNGAGKSTTMKMITGFLPPTEGKITVLDYDVVQQTREAQACMGYLPEGAPLYPDMTPRGLLGFCAAARGLTGQARKTAIGRAIERTELGGVMNQRIETLSKGFKRRVGLAQAILHDPPVLVLDEPTDGLDPNQKAQVRALIHEMSADKVVVLSTHILEEVEAVCTRATIMAEGRLRFDGTPVELRKRSRFFNSIELHLTGSSEGAGRAIEGINGVDSVQPIETTDGNNAMRIFPRDKQALLAPVTALISQRGWQVEHLFVDPGRLDDVFRVMTRDGSTEERESSSAPGGPSSLGKRETPEQLTSKS
jgi:ABC-2 type transport system ATP-binding protein